MPQRTFTINVPHHHSPLETPYKKEELKFATVYAGIHSPAARVLKVQREAKKWSICSAPLEDMAPFVQTALTFMRVKCTSETLATETIQADPDGSIHSVYECAVTAGNLRLERVLCLNGSVAAKVVLNGDGVLGWVPESVITRGIEQHMSAIASGPLSVGRKVFRVLIFVFYALVADGRLRA